MSYKKVVVGLGMLGLTSCASIGSVSEIKTWNQQNIDKAYEAGKEADVKFLMKDFDDVYVKEKSLKTIAILGVNMAWDSKRYREIAKDDPHAAHFMTPTAAPEDHRKVADAVLEQLKASYTAKGFTVLTPDQLAEKSATYAAIKTSTEVYTFSPTSGQEFQGIAATNSRYIDKWEREGDLISKIGAEAGVDAFVTLAVNQVDTGAFEAEIDDLELYGAGGEAIAYFSMCVPNDKAVAAGVRMGLFGKPNHCGSAQADLTTGRYLPSTKKADHAKFAELKSLGFDAMTTTYTLFAKGVVDEFNDEAFD